jgi:hypothetical protein
MTFGAASAGSMSLTTTPSWTAWTGADGEVDHGCLDLVGEQSRAPSTQSAVLTASKTVATVRHAHRDVDVHASLAA